MVYQNEQSAELYMKPLPIVKVYRMKHSAFVNTLPTGKVRREQTYQDL